MKWLFRIITVVFLLFVGLVIAGYLAPAKVTVVRSMNIIAEPDDVFFYINDLTTYEDWSPLHSQIKDAKIFYGGSDNGVGQTSVWKSDTGAYAFGTQEIVASQPPEFVQLAVNLAGREATSFYGISRDETHEGVMLLIDMEYSLGGFPYFQRLVAKRELPRAEQEFDLSLERLKMLVEQDVEDRQRAAAE